MQALPSAGVPAAQVLREIAALREVDLPTHGGRLFAYVYDPGDGSIDELATTAHALGAPVNGLDPTAFPSLLAMENAVVGAAPALLGGGPGGVESVVGNLTSGGTESLILAVKAARDESLRSSQYVAYADWPGYTMVNPTIASTRSGGPIAAAYGTLRHVGDEGYRRPAIQTLSAIWLLGGAVSTVDGLRLVAELESTVVAFTAVDPALDLFVLADELAARGWHTQPQLAYADLPRSIHLTVTAAVLPETAAFGADLVEAVAAARATGPVLLDPELRAFVSALSPRVLTPETVEALAGDLGFSLCSGSGSPLPGRRATINTLVEAAPVPVREALFSAFLSLLQRPTYS
jgi:glutamate/tyrosine decarboxylase-like PLP-dependent enzyme